MELRFSKLPTFVVIALMAFAGSLTGCGFHPSVTLSQRVPAPVTDGGMTLDWGRDVKSEALRLIQSSRRYCYLDMYELSDPDILNALASARHRGVDVRVVVDATESHSQTIGLPSLQKAGVPAEGLRIPQGISHIKMLVSDGHVLMGGMNFGASSWSNNDASVYIPTANPSFVALFRWDWSRGEHVPAESPSYELPLLDDRQNEQDIVEAIQSAGRSVAMEAFDLSDRSVISALDQAVKRGVSVQILLDPGQSWSRKAADELRSDGASVRYYLPYQGEWMHAKILDVDQGTTFMIGSANFSHQAFTYNHEGDLLLRGVPAFDKALQSNLALQFSRGTDTPSGHNWSSSGGAE